MKSPVYLSALGLVNALGRGKHEVAERLFAGDSSGMVSESDWLQDRQVCVGRVRAFVPALPPEFSDDDTRNNRLLFQATMEIMDQIEVVKNKYGAHRVGIVLGTSTSGIAEGEQAIATWLKEQHLPQNYHYQQQELGAPAAFLAKLCAVTGPRYVVSTACTSSAKAFAAARRLIQCQLCDAVLVGGVDSLCRLTIAGFTALESTSDQISNPLSQNRKGINIGEAAALFILQREPSDIALVGVGESSDAYHMSSPDPEGIGAEQALRLALQDAKVEPNQINYINLHGTATIKNDAMESKVVQRVFGSSVPCSSTKPLTGHTLGAAGATEAAFCWLVLSSYNPENLLPPHLWDGEQDPELPELDLVARGRPMQLTGSARLMSNSFAFGGSNVSLIFAKEKR